MNSPIVQKMIPNPFNLTKPRLLVSQKPLQFDFINVMLIFKLKWGSLRLDTTTICPGLVNVLFINIMSNRVLFLLIALIT